METIMQYIPLAVSAILLAALILTVITNIITQVVKKITWNMVAGAVALGLFVAYAAMFGFDKLREALEQITNWNKDKTE